MFSSTECSDARQIESDASPGSERYVLSTGETGRSRLEMLEELYGPTTESLLVHVGLSPSMRVVDIGCGVGTVVAWEAARLGSSGAAVGVDISTEQLAEAAKRCLAQGLMNVDFVQASVYDTGLPEDSFDIVSCRSLLSHLVDPEAAIREMIRLVRPGGVVICEDIDMRSIHADPPSSAYERIVDLYYELARITRCDYSVGRRLADLLKKAGLSDVDSRHDQPAPRRGESKRWWELTFIESAPAMITAGILDQAELHDLCERIAPLGSDSTTAIYQPTHYQAWGRKPG